jgi:ABC-type sugar transport system ATPase subunit
VRWDAPLCAIRSVFLMDEPLSNLDAKLRVQHERNHQLHRRLGVTTVM